MLLWPKLCCFSCINEICRGISVSLLRKVISNHWTGFSVDWIAGLDWWTGLLDLICSFCMISIPSNVNLNSNYLTVSCTSSSHWMLGNVHECTMHKLHGRMCIMNSWCTHSALIWLHVCEVCPKILWNKWSQIFPYFF